MNMKRWIAFLLALVCFFTLISCGGGGSDDDDDDEYTDDGDEYTDDGEENEGGSDETLAMIQEAFDSAIADYAEASITYKDADGVVLKKVDSSLTTDGQDEEENTLDFITIPYYNYITTQGSMVVLPEEQDGEFSGSPTKKVTLNLKKLNFSTSCLKNYKFEKPNFTAEITDCSKFFGVEMTQATAKISISLANNAPKRFTLEYTTPTGYIIEAKMTYYY